MLALILTRLLFSFSLTTASPALPSPTWANLPDGTKEVVGKPGGITTCEGFNFTQLCHYNCCVLANCNTFPRDEWDKISAIGVDQGASCEFYEGEQCLGDSIKVLFPGIQDLKGWLWDNRIRSWNCHATELKWWELAGN
ncbi:hypothetical protein BCR34DRAFT_592590 [Clohesyomyces aquaticus]|uniref:Uncharacterized protein n=1 Tax=Clohesyomyces aquaticus TaxID=1231657 RepID=A0A1Y1YS36_9PLEO|nr:hypothetical protein BCR34DRAFT_592590 [Clohesyomyces aquaticus]